MRILFHILTIVLIGLLAWFTVLNTELLSKHTSLPFIPWTFPVTLYIIEAFFVIILIQWIIFVFNILLLNKTIRKAESWKNTLKAQLFDEQDKLIKKITEEFKKREEDNTAKITKQLSDIDYSLWKLYSEVWFLNESNKETKEIK